jgi:Ni/Co efflux regulator RcnB
MALNWRSPVKKFILAALAATTLATPVLAAPYQGQDDRGRQEQRYDNGRHDNDRHDDRRHDNRIDGRHDGRNDRRHDRRYDRNDRGPQRIDYRRWSKGQRFDSRYAQNYRVIDARAYRLHDAPRGYRWVRSGNDAVLIGITTGLVAAVMAGAIH